MFSAACDRTWRGIIGPGVHPIQPIRVRFLVNETPFPNRVTARQYAGEGRLSLAIFSGAYRLIRRLLYLAECQ